MRSTVLDAKKAAQIIEMMAEDGATAPGHFPTDHAQAALEAENNEAIREIRKAHSEGRGPPDHANGKGPGGGA
jgi:hypothetical protein